MFRQARFSRPVILPPILCTRRAYIQVFLLLLVGVFILVVRMMSSLRGTFLHYHLESDTDGELVILPTEFAQRHRAACLDGSPPAYYYRQSAVPAARYWIIHMPGGGWCTTAVECLARSKTAVGSSLKTEMLRPFEGLMSGDCSLNPDFCLWHMVELLYCDGGSFLGNRSEPLVVDSKEVYVRGAAVFDALINYLFTLTLFRQAEQIVLVGSSSGSLGALVHADRLREWLGSNLITLHLVVDGGLFVDIPDVHNLHTVANMLRQTFLLHHSHETTGMKGCTPSLPKEEEWRCILPEVFHTHVSIPVLFINSLYDTWIRKHALKIDCVIEQCPNLYFREVINVRIRILQEGQEILRSKKNGVFFTSCPGHTLLTERTFFLATSGEYSVQQGIGDWIRDQGNSRNVVEVLDVADIVRVCPNLNHTLLI